MAAREYEMGINVRKQEMLEGSKYMVTSQYGRGGQGAGARENRGREGYGRREKKGREAGSLRWREAAEKFKKASFCYLLLLTSSQRNEPKNVS